MLPPFFEPQLFKGQMIVAQQRCQQIHEHVYIHSTPHVCIVICFTCQDTVDTYRLGLTTTSSNPPQLTCIEQIHATTLFTSAAQWVSDTRGITFYTCQQYNNAPTKCVIHSSIPVLSCNPCSNCNDTPKVHVRDEQHTACQTH